MMPSSLYLGVCVRSLNSSVGKKQLFQHSQTCMKNLFEPSFSGKSLLSNSLSPVLVTQAMGSHNYYDARIKDPFKEKINVHKKVFYPEDGVYTVKHLRQNNLAGRDPRTGRIVLHNVGGGRRTWFRWVDFFRYGPTEKGKYLEERVIAIERDPNRTAFLALVGSGNHLRYLIATSTMAVGDLIRTNSYIPTTPVRPKEGDAYPLGALPVGTQVCCVEISPGRGMRQLTGGGCSAPITAREKGKVVVSFTYRHILALDPKCMAVVGRVSNDGHTKEHVGSAQRKRWLGHRPRLGLKVKKGPKMGFKRKRPGKVKIPSRKAQPNPTVLLTAKPFGPQKDYVVGYDRRNKY